MVWNAHISFSLLTFVAASLYKSVYVTSKKFISISQWIEVSVYVLGSYFYSTKRDNIYASPKTYGVLTENKCWSSYKRIHWWNNHETNNHNNFITFASFSHIFMLQFNLTNSKYDLPVL